MGSRAGHGNGTMSVHVIDSMLFKHVFATDEMAAIFGSTSLFQKWLDAESALATAQARLGIIPPEAAEEIARKAVAAQLDLEHFRRQLAVTGQIIVPLVTVLAAACDGGAGEYVHWGATTQDIIDTGVVLQLKEAYAVIRRDLEAIRNILIGLAQKAKIEETAAPIRDKLSGISYVILAVVGLIIIGGLGWCFYKALAAAGRDTGIQHPDEVGDEQQTPTNA